MKKKELSEDYDYDEDDITLIGRVFVFVIEFFLTLLLAFDFLFNFAKKASKYLFVPTYITICGRIVSIIKRSYYYSNMSSNDLDGGFFPDYYEGKEVFIKVRSVFNDTYKVLLNNNSCYAVGEKIKISCKKYSWQKIFKPI